MQGVCAIFIRIISLSVLVFDKNIVSGCLNFFGGTLSFFSVFLDKTTSVVV